MSLRLWLLTTLVGAFTVGCTEPMTAPEDANTDALISEEDGGGVDSGAPRPDGGSSGGVIAVVGGLGARSTQAAGRVTVVGGFEPQRSCVGDVCVLGGFSRP